MPPAYRIQIGLNPYQVKKHPTTDVVGCFLAEDEGFEPPQTESESGVLPLHKSSMNVPYYTHFFLKVKHFQKFFIPKEISRL